MRLQVILQILVNFYKGEIVTLEKIISGIVHKYGDNINTDIISPPQYMELSVEEASKYSMSAVDPMFAKKVKSGDIFVAGKNLGSGSSRETAPLSLKYLGIRVVISEFFARIFYRNCINIGLIALECSDTDRMSGGDILEVNCENGIIFNKTKNEKYICSKIPDHIMKIINAGGLYEYIKSTEMKRR